MMWYVLITFGCIGYIILAVALALFISATYEFGDTVSGMGLFGFWIFVCFSPFVLIYLLCKGSKV